jgi:hypothetical protein
LFNLLGFEFSVTLGAVLAYVAGWRSGTSACEARDSRAPTAHDATGRSFPGAALLRVTGGNLALCLFPLAVIAVNSLRVPTCNWGEGLQFYALFTLPGVLYGSALGYALGLRWSRRAAHGMLVLWSVATFAWALWNVVREPPIFAYNAFVGFFPGPIYDRLIPLSPQLLLARGIVVLEAMLFVLLATLLWDGERLRPRALFTARFGARSVSGGLALVLAVVLGLLWSHADQLGLRVDRHTIQRELGGHIETEHCDIYYDVAAYTPERAAELAREHEFHFAELREFFGFEPPGRIGSYVYASADQKKRLMGAAGTSFEDALNDEFHINASRYPHPVLRHEMAHIFAAHFSRWVPICPLIGVHEGIAVAAEWREESARQGLTPDEACVAMDSLGVLPDLRRTMTWFGFWSQASRRVYTAAGSFVHYLVERYGMDRFRVLWSRRDFVSAYGHDLEALLVAWRRERLDPVQLSPLQLRRAEQLFRPPAIFAVACAHEQARLRAAAARAHGRWSLAEADSLYRELLDVAGGDAGLRLQHARVLVRARRFDAARTELLQLLEAPDLHASLRGEAFRRLGDVHWNLGQRDQAALAYARGLDWTASRDQRRGLHIARMVVADSSLEAALREYLTDIVPNEPGLALLARAMTVRPESPLPRYLMGRRLYFAGRFAEAAAALADLPMNEVLPEDARLASLELLARAHLRGGAAEQAEAALTALDAFRLDSAERMLVAEIGARAAWERAMQRAPAQVP